MIPINNLVIVSDLHAGCRLALCPPRIKLDEDVPYQQSRLQKKLWEMWKEFWNEFVPEATRKEPYAVCVNGDALEGVHHGATTQISQNLDDQQTIARAILEPVVECCGGRYYHIRGTEAHVGPSAAEEEKLAKSLGAIRNEQRQAARYDLWKRVDGKLVHILHHLGTSGSQAYEATALHKELTESFIEAARWGEKPPDVIVRSHRHRYILDEIATKNGHAIAVVTPGWQAKTPFAWKIAGARLSVPQFGGIVVRVAHGELFVRKKVWVVKHSRIE